MDKAIQGLKDAIKSMKDSKPSLLAIRQKLGKTLQMAEAMSLLKAPKHKATVAFIQQATSADPSDPEYKYHSNDIIDLCEKLLGDYKASKKELDDEWSKTKKGCEEMKASLKKQLSSNKDAMDALEKNIAKLKKEIASHREDLITAEGVLKDDELYLKDLTSRCEDRANDYDQRSAMRGDELTALTQALKVLTGTVAKKDDVNVRALFVQKAHAAGVEHKDKAGNDHAKVAMKTISLLQKVVKADAGNFLSLSQDAKKQKALDVLRVEGQRIGSLALTLLADRAL